MKAIARLFADMGDSYVELIATGSKFCYLVEGSLLFFMTLFSQFVFLFVIFWSTF